MIRFSDSPLEVSISDKHFPLRPENKTFLEAFTKFCSLKEKPNTVAHMQQIHSTTVKEVMTSDTEEQNFKNCDGLWTKEAGVMLIVKTADCVPLVLWNARQKVLATLHCGWRGLNDGIINTWANTMDENNYSPNNFKAYIGPHINWSNYEVQTDFVNQLHEDNKHFIKKKKDRLFFDLNTCLRSKLQFLGINNIIDSETDTYNSLDYHSYRLWTHAGKKGSYQTFLTAAYFH